MTLGEFYGLFAGPDGWEDIDADAFGTQYNPAVADPQSQYRIWADPNDYENYGGFDDPESTELINPASAAGDPAERTDLQSEADARLFV